MLVLFYASPSLLLYPFAPLMPVHLYACTPLRLYTSMLVHLHTFMPLHLYAFMPLHPYSCTPLHLYTCTPLCLYGRQLYPILGGGSNESKCKELHISFVKPATDFAPIVINGKTIEVVSTVKLLGLNISSDLRWNNK